MSYFDVKLNGVSIHDPKYKEMALLNPKVSLALGEAGSFDFTMGADHVFRDNVTPYGSTVEVLEDGQSIFYGRPLAPKIDMYGRKTYHCEGQLAFFNDVICAPGAPGLTTPMTDREYLAFILDYFNQHVTSDRMIFMGTVNIPTDAANVHDDWKYQTVKDLIRNDILQYSGGYLYVTRISGVNYLNWESEPTYVNNQPVELGINIQDATMEGQPFYTACIGKGTEIFGDESTEVKMTEPVILSTEALQKYGFLCAYKEFQDVDGLAGLQEACRTWLASQNFTNQAFDIGALDLHVTNNQYPMFLFGRGARVKVPTIGVDEIIPITKIEIDINTGRKRIGLGFVEYQTATRRMIGDEFEPDKPVETPPLKDPSGNEYVPSIDPNGNVIGTKVPNYIKFTTVYDHVYSSGDVLDISNYEVSAFYGDGSSAVITQDCTFSPADGYVFAESGNPAALGATYLIAGKTFRTACTLVTEASLPAYITITRNPTKMSYQEGETIDISGIYVMAHYADGSQYIDPSATHTNPDGSVKLSELSIEPTTADITEDEEYSDGDGINAWRVVCDIHNSYGADGRRSDQILGVDNNGYNTTLMKLDGVGVTFLTRYNGLIYAANESGSNQLQLCTQYPEYGWSCNGTTSATAPNQVFDVGAWHNHFTYVPVSTVDPTGKNISTLSKVGGMQTITVKWNRPRDNKELTATFEIEVTEN